MNMTFWAASYLATVKGIVFADVDKVQYQTGGTWADCTLISKGDEDNYKYFLCEVPSSVSGTITGVRFIDDSSNVLGSAAVSFTKSAGQTFAFKIKFTVREKQ
jgi:hypothetical protein